MKVAIKKPRKSKSVDLPLEQPVTKKVKAVKSSKLESAASNTNVTPAEVKPARKRTVTAVKEQIKAIEKETKLKIKSNVSTVSITSSEVKPTRKRKVPEDKVVNKAIEKVPEVKGKPRPFKDKITLEEFLEEKDNDRVRLNQISRKLTNLVSSEDRKRLNPQDLEDLKEIQALTELADIKARQKKRSNKSVTEPDPIFDED